jgi:AAA15 family ATPase/GTPase
VLVEFRVKNFKSIRDEQTLSLVANSDNSQEKTHVLKSLGISQRLLKSAVIYGANASGKSNLLQAIRFMKEKVLRNHVVDEHFPNGEYNDCPFFRLDRISKDNPSEFEVTYTSKGIRYQYGFSLLRERVVEEWILVYKADKPQEWFRRTIDGKSGEDIYKFSSYFKGQKSIWQKSTRKNALFLSVAISLNSEQLQPVYEWFKTLMFMNNLLPYYRVWGYDFLEDEKIRNDILSFIAASDLGIADIAVKSEIRQISQKPADKTNGTAPEFIEREVKRPVFIHQLGNGSSEEFELNEESGGTRRLFQLAYFIWITLKEARVLIVDELESSLHPMIARFLVGLFNSEGNKDGAQLIFSTHEAGLLDIKETFRRDQIWFVEKDKSQATVLYPLTDFNPRKDADIESGYLTGRYGAIPFLTGFSLNGDEGGHGA